MNLTFLDVMALLIVVILAVALIFGWNLAG